MPPKTAQQIQDEADRLFGKGASQQKFEWRRAQQAEAGLEQETKKRGGVAGAYDRNKALVQAAIPTLAGLLVPGAGALAGAIAGGVARGVDRPGQGGIGLDVGQAAKGALAGAGMGGMGANLRNAIVGPEVPGLKPMPASTAGPGSAAVQAPAGVQAPGPNVMASNAPRVTTAATAGRSAASVSAPAMGGMGAPGPEMVHPNAPSPMRAMTQPRMTDTFRLGPNQMAQPITGVPAAAQGRTPVGPGVIPRVPTSAQMPLPAAGGAGIGGRLAAGARTMGSLLGGGTGPGGQDGQGGIDWRGLLTNPQVIAGLTGGVADVMGQRSQQAIQEAQLAQQAEQFRQRFGAEEEERKRRIAQENRLASFFMPATRG